MLFFYLIQLINYLQLGSFPLIGPWFIPLAAFASSPICVSFPSLYPFGFFSSGAVSKMWFIPLAVPIALCYLAACWDFLFSGSVSCCLLGLLCLLVLFLVVVSWRL
ncbi:hypothetical protein KFK09_009755 [Dendrobium nobile]|uniref:Uncharacterized protein n=1 Tax=Dendrobium nobile TaxID=94219 RepID=A0A8T3BKW4_DENNO|nr:hypothetical protein KFK09_009755 [Dendrobium nobile]